MGNKKEECENDDCVISGNCHYPHSNNCFSEDWVSINSELPEPDEKVLIQYGDENVHIGRIDKDGNWWIYWINGLDRMDIDLPITHWMELPTPFRYAPIGSRYNYYCAERSHGGPVCMKQCETCAKMLP